MNDSDEGADLYPRATSPTWWHVAIAALAGILAGTLIAVGSDHDEPSDAAASSTTVPTATTAVAAPLNTTSTHTTPPPSSAETTEPPGDRLPDPFQEEMLANPRLTAREMANFAGFKLSAARANMAVTEWILSLVQGSDFLADQQSWSAELTRLCERTRGGGSIDAQWIAGCIADGYDSRAELLGYLDPATDLPINPVELWGSPVADYEQECDTRLTGRLEGEPHNAEVVTAESSVDLQLGTRWRATGTVSLSIALELADGSQTAVQSEMALWGRATVGQVAAGVYVESATWDEGEVDLGYGYWWISTDEHGRATGEMISLTNDTARSTLDLTVVGC
ncbi:MAG: hypothetical protein GY708_24400 [Actinomycetia bacterium]|nr:hypothetical protein [Actinomycetes bacterium]